MGQHFGLGLYSVRHELARDLVGTLKAVKDIGYEAVEFFGQYDRPAEEIAAALKETGLVCCGWHTPYENVQDDKIDATIAYNKTIGNRYIIIPGVWGKDVETADGWRATAAKFNTIAKKLAQHGMVTGYHNHSSEFKPMEGEIPYYLFFDNTSADVVMQIDNGNALEGGADCCDLIRKYPGRAKTVHLKPYSRKDGFDTVIGQDDIPWAEFIGLCGTIGGTEWYIAEYESEKLYSPLEGVKISLDALKGMQKEGKI